MAEVELIEIEAPAEIADALAQYFDGELAAVDTLRTQTAGTELQRRVWAAPRRIPAGTTTTYGKLAKSLGFDDPRAAIDMGAANGANPIAIIVPCHRVIASNGDLKGYGRLKGLEKAPTPRQMREIGEAWSPFRTVAAWYLWRLPAR